MEGLGLKWRIDEVKPLKLLPLIILGEESLHIHTVSTTTSTNNAAYKIVKTKKISEISYLFVT